MRQISRHLLLAVCFATSSLASSTPHIFARTCAASGFTQCTQPGVPADFCCGPTTTCIALAGNTTILCCPSGQNCATILPISCDLQAQNNTLHPDTSLKTSALTGTLQTCGAKCCPFGYTCNTNSNCVMDADQSKAPATSAVSSSTPTPTPTASSTKSSLQSSTTTPTTTPTSPSQNSSSPILTASCDNFPAPAVLVGFFPGMIFGILLTVLCICLFGARRRNQARRHSGSGSSFGNISEPQPATGDMRTDFLRKPPQTPSTVHTDGTPRRQGTLRRVKSMFRKSGMNNAGLGSRTMPGGGAGGAAPPIPMSAAHNNRPVTPPLQREPSYENINIFADGDTASALRERERLNSQNETSAARGLGAQEQDTRQSHQTTFSDMMERSGLAGLQKGQPYVYRGNSGYETPSPPRERTS